MNNDLVKILILIVFLVILVVVALVAGPVPAVGQPVLPSGGVTARSERFAHRIREAGSPSGVARRGRPGPPGRSFSDHGGPRAGPGPSDRERTLSPLCFP